MTEINYNDGNWHRISATVRPSSIHPNSMVDYAWHDRSNGTAGITRNLEAFNAIVWPQVLEIRVVKEYREPREFWLYKGKVVCRKSDARFRLAGSVVNGNEIDEIIHVREVIE